MDANGKGPRRRAGAFSHLNQRSAVSMYRGDRSSFSHFQSGVIIPPQITRLAVGETGTESGGILNCVVHDALVPVLDIALIEVHFIRDVDPAEGQEAPSPPHPPLPPAAPSAPGAANHHIQIANANWPLSATAAPTANAPAPVPTRSARPTARPTSRKQFHTTD